MTEKTAENFYSKLVPFRGNWFIQKWDGTDELVFMRMGPRPICRDPNIGFSSARNPKKGKYQCSICGREFGLYAQISFYPCTEAWSHRTCISRHVLGECESAAKLVTD